MSVVDDVKSRVDIVDLIGGRVTLRKSGSNFKANCPFHTEKTPSFFVYPDRGTWRCFGACGTGGDVFSFLQRADNLTFSEALQQLAERAGVEIQDTRQQDARQKEQQDGLYAVLTNAADYFHRLLMFAPAGEVARRYLAQRGVTEQTITDFQLGMAPNGWETLKKHLSDLGHPEQELTDAGLLVQREGDDAGSYDRFRSRLIFPVRDPKSRVIGFGARALDDSQPKYLNSPQTPVFDKSGALFALDRAQDAIKSDDQVVLVEGYMDAIQAHQSGFRNVVAVMGTSVTERQVGLVRRLTRRYALALDPDTAGDEATRRSLEGAFNLFQHEIVRAAGSAVGMTVRRQMPVLRVIALPQGRDPDDVIRKDADDWRRRVDDATPILDYLIRWEAARPEAATSDGKMAAVERIFPLIAALENPFAQQEAFGALALALNVEESTLEAAVGRPTAARRAAARRTGRLPTRDTPAQALEDPSGDPVEEHLLALVLIYGGEAWAAWERLELPYLPPECFWNPENVELWRVLTTGGAVEEAEAIVSSRAETLRAQSTAPLTDRQLGRALSDVVRRLVERQLKRQEEEQALAVSSLAAESDGDDWVVPDDMRQQAIDRLGNIRKVERGRWPRNGPTGDRT